MLEHLINQYLPTLIHLLETMGIIVLAVGAFDGFYCYLKGLLHNNFTITKSHFANSMAMSLDSNLYYESLYEYLRREQGIEISKIKQRITAGLADEVLAKELNCNKKGPMLILKRVGYDQNDEVFEYTEGQYVASRYEYYMELTK